MNYHNKLLESCDKLLQSMSEVDMENNVCEVDADILFQLSEHLLHLKDVMELGTDNAIAQGSPIMVGVDDRKTEIQVYQLSDGGTFAVDGSYLEQCDNVKVIPSPFGVGAFIHLYDTEREWLEEQAFRQIREDAQNADVESVYELFNYEENESAEFDAEINAMQETDALVTFSDCEESELVQKIRERLKFVHTDDIKNYLPEE